MMTFTAVKTNEIDTVLSILNSTALALKTKKISQWTQWLEPKEIDIKWISEKINNGYFFFIKRDHHLIGMFSLSDSDEKYWGKQNEKAKYLHSLSILPQFKGLKYGQEVIQKIKSDLTINDYKYLRLDCISTNDKLINYYQSQGFIFLRTTEINSLTFLLHQFTL